MDVHMQWQFGAGLHSSWVGEDIVAMARPWECHLKSAVSDMARLGFGLVLNLQETGEHAACGPGLVAHTGFTYDPATLQKHSIGYCHMGWPDMSVPSLPHMMTIVKVLPYHVPWIRDAVALESTLCMTTTVL